MMDGLGKKKEMTTPIDKKEQEYEEEMNEKALRYGLVLFAFGAALTTLVYTTSKSTVFTILAGIVTLIVAAIGYGGPLTKLEEHQKNCVEIRRKSALNKGFKI